MPQLHARGEGAVQNIYKRAKRKREAEAPPPTTAIVLCVCVHQVHGSTGPDGICVRVAACRGWPVHRRCRGNVHRAREGQRRTFGASDGYVSAVR